MNEQAVQTEINRSGWGVGGDKRRIVEAGTALIQGLASGDESRAVAHAIANVALALVKKENALSHAPGGRRGDGGSDGDAVAGDILERHEPADGRREGDDKRVREPRGGDSGWLGGGQYTGCTECGAGR